MRKADVEAHGLLMFAAGGLYSLGKLLRSPRPKTYMTGSAILVSAAQHLAGLPRERAGTTTALFDPDTRKRGPARTAVMRLGVMKTKKRRDA